MSRVVLLAWTPWREPPPLISRCRIAAEQAGWTTALDDSGIWVVTPAGRPAAARVLWPGRLVIAGEIFASAADRPEPDRNAETTTWGDWLIEARWGRYVALIRSPSGVAEAVVRDPSGACEALVWSQDGVAFVCSTLPDWLLEATRPDFRLNWSRVARFMTDPMALLGPGALDGLTVLAPGDLLSLKAGGSAIPLWRPAWAARRPAASTDTALSLSRTIDRCTAAWLSDDRRWIAEVSGGLDSAIVTAAATKVAPGRIVEGFNLYADTAEGDERPYAVAVANLCGLQLTTQPRAIAPFDLQALAARSGDARPALTALDLPYDQALTARVQVLETDGVLTGQGGDAILFEAPHAGVFADDWRAGRLSALRAGTLQSVARWTGRSAWSVVRESLFGAEPGKATSALASDALPSYGSAAHAWLDDLDGLPPGKRAHVRRTAAALISHIVSRRDEMADMVHPLLSQPVLELCLGLSTTQLTGGGRRGRDLARRAFSDRLPDSVRERRSKGDLSATFGRALAASLPALRAHLLDGRLAAEGVIDRRRTDAILDADHLAWRGDYGDVMTAAAIESWVRIWEGRLTRWAAERAAASALES